MKWSFQFLVWAIPLLCTLFPASPSWSQSRERPEGPRLPSEAERLGARLAAEYLARGPEAWLPYLAPESYLAGLEAERARTLLEIKAGPPNGAVWRQQTVAPDVAESHAVFTIEFPSGLEEILILTLEKGATEPRIRRVRMSADPPTGLLGLETAEPVGAPDPAGVEEAETPRGPAFPFRAVVLGAASLFLLGLGALRRSPLPAVAGLAGLGIALWLLAPLVISGKGPEVEEGKAVLRPPTEPELQSLLAVRREMASGSEETAGADLPAESIASAVANLWRAQQTLEVMALNQTDALLAPLPLASDLPLVHLLRARLALLRYDPVGAVQGFERVAEALVPFDGLTFELVEALDLHGFEKRAEQQREALADLRSRRADVHYYLASSAAAEDLNQRAARSFQRGWQLEPMRRSEILGRFYLTSLMVSREELLRPLALGKTRDAVVPCADTRSTPLPWPVESQIRTIGGLLLVEVGSSRLEVSGGCGLAPSSAEALDAATWAREKDQRLIDQLPVLEMQMASLGDTIRPGLLHQVTEASDALVRRKRWEDLVRLTENLPVETAELPPNLLRGRAAALRRVGRISDSAATLAGLARTSLGSRRFDPVTLYQLADLLVDGQQYDLALKLLARAHEDLSPQISTRRILQVKMEKRLMESSLVYETEHFRILYSPDRPTPFARQTAEILEAELVRLQHWIPGDPSGITEVLLLDFGDFEASYGSGIVGLFDGKIRLPFGEVQRFHPLIVGVMTHELAHAMITRVTEDRAPAWVHEGLAQHVEMYQVSANPIREYERRGTRLSFPVIEDVLTGFSSPYFVPLAYEQARWGFHFLDTRFGARGIHRLLAAYREGLDDEAAVRKAFGLSLEELDTKTWAWCRDQAPNRWKTHLIDYED